MSLLIIIVFIAGYLLIAFEHVTNINKAALALITGVLCWTLYITSAGEAHTVSELLMHHMGEIAGILFFLLGAMTIVELIDAHDGFEVITNVISTTSRRRLLWIVGCLAFVLSAVLDNLTTTIVMVSLMRKLLTERGDRLRFIGVVIIAANAGGAWSPIGDVTTTMLWIGGQITTGAVIRSLILPSLVCLVLPLLACSVGMKGRFERPARPPGGRGTATKFDRHMIFFSGLAVLLFVPAFKTITHLPPFMGMLLGLGVLWVLSEFIHKDKDESDKSVYSVLYALRKIDMPSILFFLGILVSISALQAAGHLGALALLMDEQIGDTNIIVLSIGLLSAIIDNVPLVAAAMGMYDLQTFGVDHYFWHFLAYCSGTGGSALIIGSAAGVAAMGMEKISFFWYLRKVSWLALIGYFGGAIAYLLQLKLSGGS